MKYGDSHLGESYYSHRTRREWLGVCMRSIGTFFSALVVSIVTSAPRAGAAVIVIDGDPADTVVRNDGSRLASSTSGRVGAGTSVFASQSGGRAAIYVFRLPGLGSDAATTITGASFRFAISSDLPDGSYDIDLYGLGARSAPAVLSTDYYAGPLDATDATLLQPGLIPADHADHGVEWMTDQDDDAHDGALTNYLRAEYLGGHDGQFVFLRLNPNRTPGIGDTGVDVAFAENTAMRPQLTMTLVPDPAGQILWPICLLGLALRRRRRLNVRERLRNAPSGDQTTGGIR